MDTTSLSSLEKLLEKISDGAVDFVIKLILALVIYIVGRFIINQILKAFRKMRSIKSIDPTAESYISTFIKYGLYVVLLVSIVALLGVPMSSVITVIASAGVAIGMALQGALSNIAGGIMLLVFRPFSVGDYINTGSEEGTVRSISLVYTVLTTVDNRRVSVPNGNLMNSSISNASAEPIRRIDLSFDISGSEEVGKVEKIMMYAVKRCGKALDKPAPQVLPVASVTDGLTYSVRVWVKTSDYWDGYEELMKEIPSALNASGIARPSTPVRINN